jgi:hypothetical protein
VKQTYLQGSLVLRDQPMLRLKESVDLKLL